MFKITLHDDQTNVVQDISVDGKDIAIITQWQTTNESTEEPIMQSKTETIQYSKDVFLQKMITYQEPQLFLSFSEPFSQQARMISLTPEFPYLFSPSYIGKKGIVLEKVTQQTATKWKTIRYNFSYCFFGKVVQMCSITFGPLEKKKSDTSLDKYWTDNFSLTFEENTTVKPTFSKQDEYEIFGDWSYNQGDWQGIFSRKKTTVEERTMKENWEVDTLQEMLYAIPQKPTNPLC